MTGTAPIVEPPQRERAHPRKRSRRGFWRKLLFGVLLFLVIAFAAYLGSGMTPAEAWRLFHFGVDIVGAKIHPVPPFKGQQHVNIMLLGVDVSNDPTGQDCRTDSIKIISADFAKSTLSVLSIPRDTWVEIPHHGHQRINGAYPAGGRLEADRVTMSKSVITKLLSDLYGQPVHIDRYMRLQTGGFDRIIDAMGGININVEKKMDYEDPSQLLYIHLKPGLQHLNGRDAEGYVRFRHDAEGDYTRMQRQDEFIRAMVAKMQTPEEKMRLPLLIGPVMHLMYTDINGADMLALKELADKVGMNGIHSAQLPTVPCYKGSASVVEVRDPDKAAQVIAETLNGPRPTVTILNGSGQVGLARTVSEQIDANQFDVQGLGTTTQPVAATAVITSERYKSEATTLADRVGVQNVTTATPIPEATFGKHTPAPPPSDITLVLGSNYTGAPQTAQSASSQL